MGHFVYGPVIVCMGVSVVDLVPIEDALLVILSVPFAERLLVSELVLVPV